MDLNPNSYSLERIWMLLGREDPVGRAETIRKQLSQATGMTSQKKEEIDSFVTGLLARLRNGIGNTDSIGSNLTWADYRTKTEDVGSRVVIENANELAGVNSWIPGGRNSGPGDQPPGWLNPVNVKTVSRSINVDRRFRDWAKIGEPSSVFTVTLPTPLTQVVRMSISSLLVPSCAPALPVPCLTGNTMALGSGLPASRYSIWIGLTYNTAGVGDSTFVFRANLANGDNYSGDSAVCSALQDDINNAFSAAVSEDPTMSSWLTDGANQVEFTLTNKDPPEPLIINCTFKDNPASKDNGQVKYKPKVLSVLSLDPGLYHETACPGAGSKSHEEEINDLLNGSLSDAEMNQQFGEALERSGVDVKPDFIRSAGRVLGCSSLIVRQTVSSSAGPNLPIAISWQGQRFNSLRGLAYGFVAIDDHVGSSSGGVTSVGGETAAMNFALTKFAFDQNQYMTSAVVDRGLSEISSRTREYFGPVDISKLTVYILDCFGDPVHLDDQDWSVVLTVEQLYS